MVHLVEKKYRVTKDANNSWSRDEAQATVRGDKMKSVKNKPRVKKAKTHRLESELIHEVGYSFPV
jgi:hypothetical protein